MNMFKQAMDGFLFGFGFTLAAMTVHYVEQAVADRKTGNKLLETDDVARVQD